MTAMSAIEQALRRRLAALEAEATLARTTIVRLRVERDAANRRAEVLAKEIEELRREITGGFSGL